LSIMAASNCSNLHDSVSLTQMGLLGDLLKLNDGVPTDVDLTRVPATTTGSVTVAASASAASAASGGGDKRTTAATVTSLRDLLNVASLARSPPGPAAAAAGGGHTTVATHESESDGHAKSVQSQIYFEPGASQARILEVQTLHGMILLDPVPSALIARTDGQNTNAIFHKCCRPDGMYCKGQDVAVFLGDLDMYCFVNIEHFKRDDNGSLSFRGRWYYRHCDTPCACNGITHDISKELYASDHSEYHSVLAIKGIARVHKLEHTLFQTPNDLTAAGALCKADDFFCRLKYCPITHSFQPLNASEKKVAPEFRSKSPLTTAVAVAAAAVTGSGITEENSFSRLYANGLVLHKTVQRCCMCSNMACPTVTGRMGTLTPVVPCIHAYCLACLARYTHTEWPSVLQLDKWNCPICEGMRSLEPSPDPGHDGHTASESESDSELQSSGESPLSFVSKPGPRPGIRRSVMFKQARGKTKNTRPSTSASSSKKKKKNSKAAANVSKISKSKSRKPVQIERHVPFASKARRNVTPPRHPKRRSASHKPKAPSKHRSSKKSNKARKKSSRRSVRTKIRRVLSILYTHDDAAELHSLPDAEVDLNRIKQREARGHYDLNPISFVVHMRRLNDYCMDPSCAVGLRDRCRRIMQVFEMLKVLYLGTDSAMRASATAMLQSPTSEAGSATVTNSDRSPFLSSIGPESNQESESAMRPAKNQTHRYGSKAAVAVDYSSPYSYGSSDFNIDNYRSYDRKCQSNHAESNSSSKTDSTRSSPRPRSNVTSWTSSSKSAAAASRTASASKSSASKSSAAVAAKRRKTKRAEEAAEKKAQLEAQKQAAELREARARARQQKRAYAVLAASSDSQMKVDHCSASSSSRQSAAAAAGTAAAGGGSRKRKATTGPSQPRTLGTVKGAAQKKKPKAKTKTKTKTKAKAKRRKRQPPPRVRLGDALFDESKRVTIQIPRAADTALSPDLQTLRSNISEATTDQIAIMMREYRVLAMTRIEGVAQTTLAGDLGLSKGSFSLMVNGHRKLSESIATRIRSFMASWRVFHTMLQLGVFECSSLPASLRI
jgi:BAH domain